MAERNLLLRVLSAAVGLPLLGALVLWKEPLGFGLLAFVAIGAGLLEYTSLLLPGRPLGERGFVVLVGVAFAVATYLRPDLALPWCMTALVAVAVATLLMADDVQAATSRLVISGFGVLYVGGLLVALPLMHRDLAQGPWWVLVAIAVTFANDTGAYLTGRTLGRHKLAPRISPGKTVEGAVGGLVSSVAFLFIARATFFGILTVPDCLIIGLAAGFLGPSGDLVESMIKRSVGAKDSGRLIPGHGGLLDRVDALMFVGAYVYVHARFFH